MRQFRIGLVAGALIAAAPATVVAQATSIVERLEEPFDQQVENPCNGEIVHITGTLRITTRITTDANGLTHVSSNLVPHVQGEGTTGAYKVLGGERFVETFVDGEEFPYHLNTTFQFNIVSQGKAPNFISTLSGHFLAEADGTVKVDFFHEKDVCVGSGQ